MTVWAGAEVAKLEEEEVEDEEEEESGNLDEEEIKKMQSDEVCGDSRSPSAFSTVEPSGRDAGPRPWALGCPILHPPLSSLGHSGPGSDSL